MLPAHVVDKQIGKHRYHSSRLLLHKKLSPTLKHASFTCKHELIDEELMRIPYVLRHDVVDGKHHCFIHCVLKQFQGSLVDESDLHRLLKVDVGH